MLDQFKMSNNYVFFKDNNHIFCQLSKTHIYFFIVWSYQRSTVKEFKIIELEEDLEDSIILEEDYSQEELFM